MAALLLGIFAVAALALICTLVFGWAFGVAARPKEAVSKSDLRNLNKADSIAERALIRIASGLSGNPSNDAQVALDERDELRTKEINAK